jgi:hypothetical protein
VITRGGEPMPALRLALSLGAMSLGTIAMTASALAGASPAQASVTGPTAVIAKGIVPPKNPGKSLSPVPDFLAAARCAGGQDGARCNTEVLKAITHARSVLEKIGGMSFSLAAYEKLTPKEQLFATVNIERIERGLPPAVVLTRSLDTVAQDGANADTDPPLASVPSTLPGGGHPAGIGGNWAGGWDNALGADYGWMYDDGLGGANKDCTPQHKAGCWGHRDIILGTFSSASACGGQRHELAMGAGHVTKGLQYGDSETELLVGVCGPTPTDVVLTWARAKTLLHIS